METVDLHKLRLSEAKLKALPQIDRYVFALVGHVFNELMALQKLVVVAKTPMGDGEFEGIGSLTNALLLVRVLAAKIHEAMDVLGKASVSALLRTEYFSRYAGLDDRWTETLAHYKANTWLLKMRNSHAFHYMTPGQWEPDLGEEDCSDAWVVVGKTYGDTLFCWHESRAGISMFKLVNQDEPFIGFETMLNELSALAGMIGECLAQGAQAYMHDLLTDDDALDEAIALTAPKLEDLRLPYFYGRAG